MTTETASTTATSKPTKTISRRLALAAAYFATWVVCLIPAVWTAGGLGWIFAPSARYHPALGDLLLNQLQYGTGYVPAWVLAALFTFTIGRAYFPK